VVQAHTGRRVIVFTHGGVLDMLWRAAQNLPLHGARSCDIPNTGINRLRWRDGTLQIVQWADAAHLDGLPAQPDTTPLNTRDTAPAQGAATLAPLDAAAATP
jgi:probable phosphoglycerate mutase